MGDLGDLVNPSSSPLTGGYLLVVLAEPRSEQHKEALLKRLAKGLLSWDVQETQIDIESELQSIAAQCPQGEDVRNGEKLIQIASDSLVTEILIHPQVNTFKQCLRNLMASFTRHRHIVHAGYTLSGTGSWVLQDGLFDSTDFLEILQDAEVQRLLRAYEPGTITMDIHCVPEGEWTLEYLNKDPAAKAMKLAVNPADRLALSSSGLSSFVQYVSDMLPAISLEKLLEPSDVVGNIRFSHPTLYVFPGGQGDSALFGISGFNILVDGGFGRKPCFWDFTRHLDRLDAVVMTRFNTSSLSGLTGAIDRKATSPVYPQVGHIFCNIPQGDASNVIPSPDGDKDSADPLLIHVSDVCHSMCNSLNRLQLKAQPIYRSRSIEPVNLYHKVGHGTLDMYVISPSLNSSEVKDFMRMWANGEARGVGAAKRTVKMGGREFQIPLLDLISVCALLVWQPADPAEPVTRILFPGSAPQHKILEGLEKIRHLEFMKVPVFTAKSLAAAPVSAAPPKLKAKSNVTSTANNSNEKLIERKTAPASRTGGVADVAEVRQLVKSVTSASKAKAETKEKSSKSVASELKKGDKSKSGDSKEGLEKEAEQNKSTAEKLTAAKKMKSVDSTDSKEADKPRVKSSDVKSRIDSHLIASRTDSGEIRRAKADSKPKAAKETPALKKEPSSSSSSSVVNGAAKGTPPLKIKKEVANMKVAESKVNGLKGAAAGSSSPAAASAKKSADAESKEPAKKRPVTRPKDDAVKEVKKATDKPKSPKDETKEVRPKTKTDKSETKTKEAAGAESKPKLVKPKPKAPESKSTSKSTAVEVKAEAKEKPKVTKSESKVVRKEATKPKEASKPSAAKAKPADKKSKSDKPPAGSTQPVPIKSVKRPPKPVEAADAAVAVGAAVAAVVAVAAAAESEAAAVEVVEETIVATEAAEAASAPSVPDAAEAQPVESNQEALLAAIESEIVAATGEQTEEPASDESVEAAAEEAEETEEAEEAPAAEETAEAEEVADEDAVETEAAAEEAVEDVEEAVQDSEAATEEPAEEAAEEAAVEEAAVEEAAVEEAAVEDEAEEEAVTEEEAAEEAVAEEVAAEEEAVVEEDAAEEETAVDEDTVEEAVAEEAAAEEEAAEDEVVAEDVTTEEKTAVKEAAAKEEAVEDDAGEDDAVEETTDHEAVEETVTEEEVIEDEVVEEEADLSSKQDAAEGDAEKPIDVDEEVVVEVDAPKDQEASVESNDEEKVVKEMPETESTDKDSGATAEAEAVAEEQLETQKASAADQQVAGEGAATEKEIICRESDKIEAIKEVAVGSEQVDHEAEADEPKVEAHASTGAVERIETSQQPLTPEVDLVLETAKTPVDNKSPTAATEEDVVHEAEAITDFTSNAEVDVVRAADEAEDKEKGVVDADKDLDETELVVKKESNATPAEVQADNLIKADRKPSIGDNKVDTAECLARSDHDDVDDGECRPKETRARESLHEDADEVKENVTASQPVAAQSPRVEAQTIDLDYRGRFETSASDAGDNLQLNVSSAETTSMSHEEELSSIDSQPADYEFKKTAPAQLDVSVESSVPDSGPPSMEFSVNLACEPVAEKEAAADVQSQPSTLDLSLGSADEVDEEFTAERVTKPSPVFDPVVDQDDRQPVKSPVKADSPVKKSEKTSPVRATVADSGDEGIEEVREEFYQEIKTKDIESEVSQQNSQTADSKENLILDLDTAAGMVTPTEEKLREIEAAVEMTGRKLLEDLVVSKSEDQESVSPSGAVPPVQGGSSSVTTSPAEQQIDMAEPLTTRAAVLAEERLLESQASDVKVAVDHVVCKTDDEGEPDAGSTDVHADDTLADAPQSGQVRRDSSHETLHQHERPTAAGDDAEVQVSQLTAQSAEYVTVSTESSTVASPRTPLATPLSDGSQTKSPVDEVKPATPPSPVKVETTITQSSPTSPLPPKSPLDEPAAAAAIQEQQMEDDDDQVHEEFDHKVQNQTELSLTVTDTVSGISSTPVSPRSATPKSPLSPRKVSVHDEVPFVEEQPQKLLMAAQLAAVPITPSTSSPKAPLTPQHSAETEMEKADEEAKEATEAAATSAPSAPSAPSSPLSPRPTQVDEESLAKKEEANLSVQVPACPVTSTSSPKSPPSPADLQAIDSQPLLMKVEDKTPLDPKSPPSAQSIDESVEKRVESPIGQDLAVAEEAVQPSISSSLQSPPSPRLTEQICVKVEEQIASPSSTPKEPLSPRPADQEAEAQRHDESHGPSTAVDQDKVASATSTPQMPLSPRHDECEADQADPKPTGGVSTPKASLSPRPAVTSDERHELEVSVVETKTASSPTATPKSSPSPRPADESADKVEDEVTSAPSTPKSPLSPLPAVASEDKFEASKVEDVADPESSLPPRPVEQVIEKIESPPVARPPSPKATLQAEDLPTPETTSSSPTTLKSPFSPHSTVQSADKPEESTPVESHPMAVTPKSPLSPRPADQPEQTDGDAVSAPSTPKAPLSPRPSAQIEDQSEPIPESPSLPCQLSDQVAEKVVSAAESSPRAGEQVPEPCESSTSKSPLPHRLDDHHADGVQNVEMSAESKTPDCPLSPRLADQVVELVESAIEAMTPKSPASPRPTEKVADLAESFCVPKTPTSPKPSERASDAAEIAFESSIPESPLPPQQSVAETESAVGSSPPKSPVSPRLSEQSDMIDSFVESAPESPPSPQRPVQSEEKVVEDADVVVVAPPSPRSPVPDAAGKAPSEPSEKPITAVDAVDAVSQSAHVVDTDLVSPPTASTTYFDGYLLQYEGVQASGTRLSTITSSGDVDTDSVSLDSNISSRTFDKLASGWKAEDPHDAAPSAFSSGPSSWDVCEKESLKTIITAVPADDQSATSSIVSHVTDDYPIRMELDRASIISQESSVDETLADRREAKPIVSLLTPSVGDSSLLHESPSPVPSSPFSAEAKDSMSSLQTDSSDFCHLSESKVDDSASSMQSEYSDRISDRAPTTPFSDTSTASSYNKDDRTVSESTLTKSGSGLKESAKAAFDSGLDISAPAEYTVAASVGEVTVTHHSDFDDTTADPKQPANDQQWTFKDDTFPQMSGVIATHRDAPVEERYSEAARDWERHQYYPAAAESADSLHGESVDPSGVPSDCSGEYYGQQYTYYDEQHTEEVVEGDDRRHYDMYESDGEDRAGYGYADQHYSTGKYAETAAYDHHDDYEHEGDHRNGNAYHFYHEENSSQSIEPVQPYVDPNRNDATPSPRGAADSFVPAAFVDAAPSRQESSHVDERAVPQQQSPQQQSPQQQQVQQTSLSHEETVASWGKPLGLPTPVAPVAVNGVDNKKSSSSAGLTVSSPLKRSKLAAAANGNGGNTSAAAPFYVDLAYIPHHGDPKYCDVEFFKRVRARHYVLSTLEPSAQVLEALLEGKQSWAGSDKDLDVTIIPTYDSDALGQWVSANEELLARNRIDLAPSASRCTINLQDHETSCSAYRLEF